MIQYSNLTLGKVLNDVMIGLSQYRTPENIEPITLINIVNSSIYEVMFSTLPFKDWAYTSRLDVQNNLTLPVDFIRKIRVMLRGPEVEAINYCEARYIDPREWYTVTHRTRNQQFNMSSTIRPVYTIWGDTESIPYQFAPTRVNTLTIYIHPTPMIGYMDCYLNPVKVSQPNDIIFIPVEFEDILLNTIKIKILGKFAMYQEAKDLYQYNIALMKNVQTNMSLKQYTEKREQESFVEKVIPYIQPDPLPEQTPENIAVAAPQNGGPRGD